MDSVSEEISKIAGSADVTLLAPLGIGNHVDHQLTRRAAEEVDLTLCYYSDFPYVLKNEHLIGYQLPQGAKGEVAPVSRQGLEKWQDAMAAYTSQIGTFWPDTDAMRATVEASWASVEGVQLWHPPV